ncbi:MAG TPA: GspH/FimT family pseudopilin [Fluviicoccus sp.]|nr:GspH/FimT family pseudopilin [Fluviicoccus sp.]
MKSHGWTVLELLVVIVIAACLIVYAVPAFSELMRSLEARRVTAELLQLCNESRTQALGTHRTITLCGSSDGRQCDHEWARGVLRFVDIDRNGVHTVNEDILGYTPLEISPSRLAWKGFQGKVLTYESFGTSYAGNGTFTYCPEDSTPRYRRQVVVSRSGRVRTSRDLNGDGIHETASGGQISCPP